MSEGDEVVIYTFSLQYPDFLFPGKTQYSTSQAPDHLNIKVCINSVNPLNWLKVGRELNKLKLDLIVVRFWLPFMGPCLGSILRLAKGNNQTKIVAITDNVIPHEKRTGDKLFTSYFLKSVDACIAMSDKVIADLKSFTSTPSKLVSHPLYDNFGPKLAVEDARIKLGISKDKKVFLFFGFIRKYKGLDLLIDACDLYDLKANNAVLLIAGEFYAGENEILDKINLSSSKSEILMHTSFIADEDVATYLSAADFVVQPYRNATQSGVTPLAYHFEVPMIVTNVGGLPEMVPAGIGIICEPHSEAIAQSMKDSDTFNLDLFGIRIKEEKIKYEWSSLTNEIRSI